MKLTYDQENFYLDNKKITILSGAIHYFRVVPEYWEDRLKKLKACGFNTVETYMPWNLHEEVENEYNFSGMLDIERFLNIAKELGLYAIVRPGPYICAEWEFGGFPAWLLKDSDMKLRCHYAPYEEKVRKYFHEVMTRLRPHLLENGGNIIMMQVENEYGSYGNDKDYLRAIEQMYHDEQMNVCLFTSDGDDDSMLNGGTLPHLLKIVNFGSNSERNFNNLLKVQPDAPLMCGEFWNGWFDHWGEAHHVREADDTAKEFDAILNRNGSINFYMFHGGTNFNFYNGANYYDDYAPTVTSYDYHCLLNESGDRTEKYYACQNVIRQHGFEIPELECIDQPKKAYGKITLDKAIPLFACLDQLSKKVSLPYVLPMEKLDQNFGYILYRTHLTGPYQPRELNIHGLHDRATIYLDGKYVGIIERNQPHEKIMIGVEKGQTIQLDILVENMGRVNYGPELYDRKGITKAVCLGLQELHHWEMYPLPMKELTSISYKEGQCYHEPAFYQGTFEIDECQDTFIYLDHFNKGHVYINGFNLGRYWKKGPQRSLYIPAPLLKQGINKIEIFEIHQCDDLSVELKDTPDLG